MGSNNLYIIGNGFDIHHRINSRYSDFKDYLSNANYTLHNLIEEFIPVKENWADLEQALADLDVDSIMDSVSDFLVPYSAENWSDSYHHDYQLEIKNIIKSLSSGLKDEFTSWISQLNIPSPNNIINKLLSLDVTGRYLTFNYTATLHVIYDIPEKNTLFIHGEVRNESSELILGHAWNPVDIPSSNTAIDPDNIEDIRFTEGKESINKFFGATFKPTRKIIENNSDFFRSLRDISNIFILGHSLSQIDIEYFQAITKFINRSSVEWKISYYNISERKRHQETMNKLGVDNRRVEFKELQAF